MTKSIILPDIPGAGDELEDYVAALFQASGHFVEKQVVEQDPLDVLELDIVATNYSSGSKQSRLIEVKGGGWGHNDLFKVVGWMNYLNITDGAFFVTDWFDLKNAADRMKPLGLDVVCYDNFLDAPKKFAADGFGSFVEPHLIDLWRHSFNLERALLKETVAAAKAGTGGGKAARSYYKLINHGTFFARTPQESLTMLYDAYKEHPRLALSYALELDGQAFDPQAGSAKSKSYQEALREGKHPGLQACMYAEQRARVAILKAAVDYAESGAVTSTTGKWSWSDILFELLPETFKSGLKWLVQQPTYHLYPTFWQQFLWGWGGFYLEDRASQEFEWMSKYSGIPANEIPIALEAFDHFFPFGGSWLVTPGWTSVRTVRLVPFLFQGIGAHHRRVQYGAEDLNALKASGYTVSDLAKRINRTVDYLA